MTVREKLRGEMLAQMRRYPQRGWIAGVCAGLAEHFNWNVKLLRLILVVVGLCTRVFPLALAYMVLWYLMDPADTTESGSTPNLSSGTSGTQAANSSTGGAAPAGRGVSSSAVKARFARLEQRLGSMEDCVVSRDFELRQELKRLES